VRSCAFAEGGASLVLLLRVGSHIPVGAMIYILDILLESHLDGICLL
jgi:hypothetical protein